MKSGGILLLSATLLSAHVKWEAATESAPWSACRAATVLRDTLWVVDSAAWFSTDGASWVPRGGPPWWPRTGFALEVFENKVWVMGGRDTSGYRNDVWNSPDFVNWTQMTGSAQWSGRAWHRSVAFNGRIWVLGGHDGSNALNDVWWSSDGASWTLSGLAPWFPRYRHAAVALGGAIWVFGGRSTSGSRPRDVWFSSDGVSWTQASGSAPWAQRDGHAAAALAGLMWVMGGEGDSGLLNDVWYGQGTPDTAEWSPRTEHSGFVFRDKLWVLGGSGEGGHKRDVWFTGGLGVAEGAGSPSDRTRVFGVCPSVIRTSAEIHLSTGLTEAALDICDMAGNVVKTLAGCVVSRYRGRVAWDGRDERGQTVPPGVYVVRVRSTGGTQVAKVVKLQ